MVRAKQPQHHSALLGSKNAELDPATRLLTIAEAADYLNVPFTWLRDKVTAREVPHTRLGRHVRFAPDHLARIISDGEQSVRSAAPNQGVSPGARKWPVGPATA
jgi:excisionase family DNA binding protein